MTIRELLAAYYKGLDRKTEWEAVLADDFRFMADRSCFAICRACAPPTREAKRCRP